MTDQTEKDVEAFRESILANDAHLGLTVMGATMHPQFVETVMHAYRTWISPPSGVGAASLQFDAMRLHDALAALMVLIDRHVTETARANVHLRYTLALLNTPTPGPEQGH